MSISLPKTYRAAQISEKHGKFKIVELPIPTELPDGEVLIQVEACGICHGDRHAVDADMPGVPPKYPHVVGHEVAGRVVSVHPNAKIWKVGDRVAVGWHGKHCFECNNCRHGDFTLCSNGQSTGVTRDGGYAEYMTARWEAVARIPDSISFSQAGPLVCAGVTVFNSLRNTHAFPGSLVAVEGIGGLGHLAIQIANRCGYCVVAISTSDDKKTLAKELGAHHFINSKTSNVAQELQKLGGARVVLATSFNSQSQTSTIGGLATDGELICLGVPHEPVTVHVGQLLMKRGAVKAWPSGEAMDSEETLKFAALTKVKTYVEEYPFEKVQEAYDRMLSNDARFRVVLTFKH